MGLALWWEETKHRVREQTKHRVTEVTERRTRALGQRFVPESWHASP